MFRKKGFWRPAGIVAFSVLLVLSTVACSSGIPQADYDAVKQQLATEQKKATDLQQQLTAATQQTGASAQQVKALQDQVAKLEPQVKAFKGALVAAVEAKPVVRPSPTPGPSPTPRPIPAAEYTKLAFYVDTTTGNPTEFNIGSTKSCLKTGNFKRGMRVVFRATITDTSTGKVLQKADVAKAVVKLPDGKELPMSWGPHGSTEIIWIWVAGWTIPPDYPLGAVKFTVEATTTDGKSATFKEIAPDGTNSALTVIE